METCKTCKLKSIKKSSNSFLGEKKQKQRDGLAVLNLVFTIYILLGYVKLSAELKIKKKQTKTFKLHNFSVPLV